MENDNNKDFALKLLDIMRDSSNKTESRIETIANIIGDLVKSTTSPSHKEMERKLSDIKEEIEEASRNALISSQHIEECRNNSAEIKVLVERIESKIKNVLLVIVIAFTLMVGAYFFVSSSVSNIVQNEMEEVRDEAVIDKEVYNKLKYLFKDINIEDNRNEADKASK